MPLKSFAREIGIKPMYLAQILGGHRNPGKCVLKFLRLGKHKTVTVTYFDLKRK